MQNINELIQGNQQISQRGIEEKINYCQWDYCRFELHQTPL